ncbi:hypothetical protein COB52_01125 [Candidatus Kaiserbacteria bacterium]|nr:MAG: hypothetical protein COB52_01125 [Candidatus Kaiserbacteria bacterium]
MSIKVLGLDEESKGVITSLVESSFLDGECYAFSEALHEGLGWPIYGLIQGGDVLRHTAVKASHTMFFDARGEISLVDLFTPFGNQDEFAIKEVESHDLLLRNGESKNDRLRSIALARRFAETLWPDLPWKDSLASRVSRYLCALEELDKVHGFCVRSQYPAARPVIGIRHGDETGYEMEPTASGNQFLFDRTFTC